MIAARSPLVVLAVLAELALCACGSSGSGGSVGVGGTTGMGGSGATTTNEGEVLVESEFLVLELAVDDTTLYWQSDNLFHGVPAEGGSPTDVGDAEGDTFALDATHAYFPGGTRGTITKLAKTGGDLSTIVSGEKDPNGIAVDESGVYWSNWSSYDTAPVADGSIARADLDGADVTTLAADLVYPRGIALDESSLYFVSAGDDTLYRLPRSGGTPTPLASDLYDASPPLFADGSVYLRTRGRPDDPEDQDAIVRVDPDSGGSQTVVSERYGIGGIAVHGGFVYYTRSGGFASCDNRSGVVKRVSVDGSVPADLAVKQSDPALLTVNDSGIYWSNGSSSSHACKNIVRTDLP